MRYGEVWWVDFDERRPVVLLSEQRADGFRAMQVVAPAQVEIDGVAAEVRLGPAEGLPYEGVLRVALPRPGLVPCTWELTVAPEYLIERAGVLSAEKLGEVEDLLRLGGLE
jgi:mRNA interferase MazF